MKKIIVSFLFTFIFFVCLFPERFEELAEPDEKKASLILGTWKIIDSDYTFEYTKKFVVKIYGIKFYHYKTSQKPFSNEYIYAVLKIKKYKKSYLCRGIYKNGRPVGFSTSVIVFRGKDKFTVYSQKNSRKIYFQARRII